MRISGGVARGIPLVVPKGDAVRPATDGILVQAELPHKSDGGQETGGCGTGGAGALPGERHPRQQQPRFLQRHIHAVGQVGSLRVTRHRLGQFDVGARR